MQDKKVLKNYAFIDAQNLHQSSKNWGWKLDYTKFRAYLTDFHKVGVAYLFMGYMQQHAETYLNLQKKGFVIVFREALEHNGQIYKANCDTDLVLQTMIDYNEYDKAVIVSGDGDFNSLINYLVNRDKLELLLVPNKGAYSQFLKKSSKNKLQYINTMREELGDEEFERNIVKPKLADSIQSSDQSNSTLPPRYTARNAHSRLNNTIERESYKKEITHRPRTVNSSPEFKAKPEFAIKPVQKTLDTQPETDVVETAKELSKKLLDNYYLKIGSTEQNKTSNKDSNTPSTSKNSSNLNNFNQSIQAIFQTSTKPAVSNPAKNPRVVQPAESAQTDQSSKNTLKTSIEEKNTEKNPLKIEIDQSIKDLFSITPSKDSITKEVEDKKPNKKPLKVEKLPKKPILKTPSKAEDDVVLKKAKEKLSNVSKKVVEKEQVILKKTVNPVAKIAKIKPLDESVSKGEKVEKSVKIDKNPQIHLD